MELVNANGTDLTESDRPLIEKKPAMSRAEKRAEAERMIQAETAERIQTCGNIVKQLLEEYGCKLEPFVVITGAGIATAEVRLVPR